MTLLYVTSVFQADELTQPDTVSEMIRFCEIYFMTVWLLVLLPDQQFVAGTREAPQAKRRIEGEDLQAKETWSHVRTLAAILVHSHLKVSLQVTGLKAHFPCSAAGLIIGERAPCSLA